MKVNRFHKLFAAVLAAVVALGTIGLGTGEVSAASNDYIDLEPVMWAGQSELFDVTTDVYTNGNSGSYTITKVSSNKPSVIRVSLDKSGSVIYGNASARKPGKATIKVTYKDARGNKKKVSQKITVKKYPEAIRKLKVNGKTVKTGSKNLYSASRKCKTTRPAIKVFLKKGWSIESASATSYKGSTGTSVTVNKAALKKGSKISFPKGYKSMNIKVILVNKKHEHFTYTIMLNR